MTPRWRRRVLVTAGIVVLAMPIAGLAIADAVAGAAAECLRGVADALAGRLGDLLEASESARAEKAAGPDHFAALLEADDESQRNRAIVAAYTMAPDDAAFVSVLIAGLRDSDPLVRVTCALGLGNIGPGAEAALAALSMMADLEREEFLRETAAEAIGKIRDGG